VLNIDEEEINKEIQEIIQECRDPNINQMDVFSDKNVIANHHYNSMRAFRVAKRNMMDGKQQVTLDNQSLKLSKKEVVKTKKNLKKLAMEGVWSFNN